MTMLVLVLFIALIGMIVQGAFIAVEHKEQYVPAVILKGAASLFFVIIGCIGYVSFYKYTESSDLPLYISRSFCLMICLGLVFGLLGDVFLELRFVLEAIGQKVFLVGILFFFIGHILYMAALIPLSDNPLVCILIGAAVAAVLLIIIFNTMEVKLAFKIFGIFYIGAVVIMTAIAVGNFIARPAFFTAIFAIGAIFFTISDVVLIFNTFGKTQRFSLRITNLAFYYVGQLLIAFSLFAFAMFCGI